MANAEREEDEVEDRSELATIKSLLFTEMYVYDPDDQYKQSARQNVRFMMGRLIEEAVIDGRMWLIKRWRDEQTVQIRRSDIPHILFREYAFIALPDVKYVNKIGDVVLSDSFTRTANKITSESIVFVALDLMPIRTAEMHRRAIVMPTTGERVIVWECKGIEG